MFTWKRTCPPLLNFPVGIISYVFHKWFSTIDSQGLLDICAQTCQSAQATGRNLGDGPKYLVGQSLRNSAVDHVLGSHRVMMEQSNLLGAPSQLSVLWNMSPNTVQYPRSVAYMLRLSSYELIRKEFLEGKLFWKLLDNKTVNKILLYLSFFLKKNP